MTHRPRRGLATWLTGSHTPLFVLDERNVVLVFNQGCEQLTGWAAAEVIGKVCVFRSDGNVDRVESLTGALAPPRSVHEGNPARSRVMIGTPGGETQERDVHFFPLMDDGQVKHVLGLITSPDPDPSPQTAGLRLDAARHLSHLYAKYGVDRLVARSPRMQRVASQVTLARQSTLPVHLVGEKGTGREHIARLIHYAGEQRARRFVPLRCRQSSPYELERTLAVLAELPVESLPGALYLEDVDQLPGTLQPLLLRQLALPQVRWYSSSVAGLPPAGEGDFLIDLESQLTPLTIVLPPLRERQEDIPFLAQQLLEESNTDHERQWEGFSPAVERLFLQYGWPGNVDELSAVIHRALRKSVRSTIDEEDLPYDFAAGRAAEELRPRPELPGLDAELEACERKRILAALAAAGGNKSAAADSLKIPRARLYRRLEALGLESGESDDSSGGISLEPEGEEE